MKKNVLKKIFFPVYILLSALLFIQCNSDDNDSTSKEVKLDDFLSTYIGLYSLDGGVNYNINGSVKILGSGGLIKIEPVNVSGNPDLATVEFDQSYFEANGSGFSTKEEAPHSVKFYKNDNENYCEIIVKGNKGYYFKTKVGEEVVTIPNEYFTTYGGSFGGGALGKIKITKSKDYMIIEPSLSKYSTVKVKISDLKNQDGCLTVTGLYLCKQQGGDIISIGINESLAGYNFLGSTGM